MRSSLQIAALVAIAAGSFFSGWVTRDASVHPLRDLTSAPLSFLEDRCTDMAARRGVKLEWTEISEEKGLYDVKGSAPGYPRVICSFDKQGVMYLGYAFSETGDKGVDLMEWPQS